MGPMNVPKEELCPFGEPIILTVAHMGLSNLHVVGSYISPVLETAPSIFG